MDTARDGSTLEFGSKADVHVHSRYSDRPSDWFLRRIGSPESFVEPQEVYRTAKARGMDFVTISDHNCIDGALEIAHLPDSFISCEVTTYFPEDSCKIHCLVLGIDEDQFAIIQEIRDNIYDLREFLIEEELVYSVAHPFYRINDRLEISHVEKLLLLFNRFEGINGTRNRRACDLVNLVFRNLTRDKLEELATRYDIEPAGPAPWVKTFTGGSDDHSGLYIGHAHTVTPPAANIGEFLNHIHAGHHEMAGEHGGSLLLAHCIYQIGYSYYKDRFLAPQDGRSTLLSQMFERLLDEPERNSPSFREKLRERVHRRFRARRASKLNGAEQMIYEDLSTIFSMLEDQCANGNGATADRRIFDVASRVSNVLSYTFVRRLERNLREGRLIDSIQTFASLGPVAMGVAPYIVSFATQHKDEEFLNEVVDHFPSAGWYRHRPARKAWLTDTYHDINGVANTIRNLARQAYTRERHLEVITCLREEPQEEGMLLTNFAPAGDFEVPEYPSQRLSFPPILELVEHLERQEFTELIISTPGPVGLVGLAASRMLNLPTVGIYHTDFPAYVRHLTEDSFLEQMTWRYMRWFYDQMDTVLVPTMSYFRQLSQHLDPVKLQVMDSGIDTDRFNPAHRVADFWRQHGLDGDFVFLYVGRVSQEKNIDDLIGAFRSLYGGGESISLAIVGDGPYLNRLKKSADHPQIAFTGALTGASLSAAYASADAFVFPSKTDTRGNVVMEALASGLATIVTDQGGPADIVRSHSSGIIAESSRKDALEMSMRRVLEDPVLRDELRRRGLSQAQRMSWRRAANALWDLDIRRPTKRDKSADLYAIPEATEEVAIQ